MGDIGDYWREAKEHRRRREQADRLGLSMAGLARWERQCRREDEVAAHRRHIDASTIQCECGKWLKDESAHRQHKAAKGKNGHGVQARKEAVAPEDNWAIF